ncbi:response regulator [Brevundimonas basaltis]|uniref:DNA-binding response OmpR family regulator n=1 Tax=Brevundimonas basaltis TaxID=472166 RepID=A0A7W8HZN6_9CAUL|nr:response regulator [Brevundimonas basaltis]MBB5292818.1 DNA-binding response OmpR family regulator [Brevundimonas basaltis]
MKPLHVLIAEDDRHLAALLRQTLEAEGFRVTAAEDGDEAVAKADIYAPDLIILDAMMPVLDGFAVLKHLRSASRHRRIPILMLTAMRGEADVRRALAGGASDYLAKPFRPDQLVQRVRRLAEARSGPVRDLP